MIESRWPNSVSSMQPPQWLFDRLHCTVGRLEALRDAAKVSGQFTGEIALLDVTANRVKREYAGMLFYDSMVTMADLNAGIDHVNHDMVPAPATLQVCS
jgi:hypothetical protein